MGNTTIGLLAALMLLGACTREAILPGQRFDVRTPLAETLPGAKGHAPVNTELQVNKVVPIRLPKAVAATAWTHRNGSPSHVARAALLAVAPKLIWSAGIGRGNTRRHRISADPVAANGRIFTIDARALVTAHGTDGGQLWSVDLTPAGERENDASDGGLALDGGHRLYATTGFGEVVALDAATGKVIWRQKLDASLTAPTVAGGIVYVVARDSHAWAIAAKDGRILWELPGTPAAALRVGGASPALTGRLAIFPFGSGELIAALRKNGIVVWKDTIAGERPGRPYDTIFDITGDPVVSGGTIFVGNMGGRVAAITAKNGKRLWAAEDGAASALWPVGGSVFYISDINQLVRRDARTGKAIWRVDLPRYKLSGLGLFSRSSVGRRKGVYAHFGPILAGGRLLVASSDGLIRFFDPASGALLSTIKMKSGAAADPIVVGGTLYIVTENGKLNAFR